MARLNINIGTTANDKTGDPLRTAFDKVNQNFVELYALANADVQIPSQTGNSNKFLTTNGTTLSWTSISQEVGTANTGFVDDRIYNLNGVIVSNDDLVHGATARLTIPEYGDTVNPITLYNNYGNISILNGSGGVISNTWTFGTDGNTILPESTVPVTLAGKVGDKAGTVAIDGNYIYYCTTDYVGGGGGGGTVTLVPNELGQNVNTLTITKGAPPNTGWATPQVGWTLTVNSTTVTIEQIDDLGTDISIIVSGFITLPPTGSVTFVEGGGVQPDIWVKQKWGVDPVVPTDISQLTDTTNLLNSGTSNQLVNSTYSVTLDNSGNTTFPSQTFIRQNNSFTRSVTVEQFSTTPSVIWTGTGTYITSAKLVIQVEGYELGDSSGWHTQVCEAIISDRYWGNPGSLEPVMSVYGVVHTSVAPLITLSIQRNPTTYLIEVVATPTATANGTIYPRVHSVELGTRD
jgi:hypothetical protein